MSMKQTSRVTNKEFSEKDGHFLFVCGKFNVTPTKRQASKFRRGLGKASKLMRGVKHESRS